MGKNAGCKKNRSKEGIVAQTIRDIMTKSPECAGENDTILAVAQKLNELDVGSLPICGTDDKLKGMITDRDIVVKVIAKGKDPSATLAGDLARGTPVMVQADDSPDEAMKLMGEHKVRRLPVLDGKELVGIVSQGDIALNLDDAETGRLVEVISGAP